MPSGVVEKARLELSYVGDPFSVGRPVGSGVRPWVRSDLCEVSTLVRIVRCDHPNVAVIRRVGVRLRAIAAERYEFAIGRPGRLGIVQIARVDLLHRFRRQVEYIKVGTAAVEVADFIPLE